MSDIRKVVVTRLLELSQNKGIIAQDSFDHLSAILKNNPDSWVDDWNNEYHNTILDGRIGLVCKRKTASAKVQRFLTLQSLGERVVNKLKTTKNESGLKRLKASIKRINKTTRSRDYNYAELIDLAKNLVNKNPLQCDDQENTENSFKLYDRENKDHSIQFCAAVPHGPRWPVWLADASIYHQPEAGIDECGHCKNTPGWHSARRIINRHGLAHLPETDNPYVGLLFELSGKKGTCHVPNIISRDIQSNETDFINTFRFMIKDIANKKANAGLTFDLRPERSSGVPEWISTDDYRVEKMWLVLDDPDDTECSEPQHDYSEHWATYKAALNL